MPTAAKGNTQEALHLVSLGLGFVTLGVGNGKAITPMLRIKHLEACLLSHLPYCSKHTDSRISQNCDYFSPFSS